MAVVTQTIQDQVSQMYIAYFGRAPESDGFAFWCQSLANGTPVTTAALQMANSFEFRDAYNGLTPTQQVTKLYTNVLNRAPDASGLAYWTNLLNTGTSIGSVAWGIVNSAFQQGTATADGNLVLNKVSVSEFFAVTLNSNDKAVAQTAFNLVTSNPASVAVADAALAQAVAPTYTLTTSIETVPASGLLPAYAKVTGVVATAGSTFQTGDTINGSGATNRVEITDASTVAGNVVATVSNVGEIKHNLVGALNTYDESLYSNVAEEYASNASVAGNTLTLLNGQLATTYGVKDSAAVASVLNVGIRAADTTGTANTLKLSVRNAGSTIVQAGVAPVPNVATINSTSTGIEAIAIVTSGVNNIAITDTPAAGVATDYAKLTVTGDGANTINVAALTQNLSYDLSAATGTNTLNFGAALQSNTVILGGNAADTVRVAQGTVVAGISLTDVETLRSSVDSGNGTIAFTTSSLKTIRIDGDAAEAGRLTLIAPGSVTAINFIGDGLAAGVAGVEQFKALTITGAFSGSSDAVTVTMSNAGTTNLAGYTVNAGGAAGTAAILANGIETLTVNATEVGAAATTTFTRGIASNTLQSIAFTTPGAVAAGLIDAAPATGNSALTLVDFSGVKGTAASSVSFDAVESVGAATQVKGTGGTGNFTVTTGVQGAADTLLITGGLSATTTIDAQTAAAGRAAFAGTLSYTSSTAGVTNTLNVGDLDNAAATNSTTIATFTGAGSVNGITGGVGVDTITVSASGTGSVNTVDGAAGADVINGAGSTVGLRLTGGIDPDADTITGGAGADQFRFGSTTLADTITNFTDGTDFVAFLDGANAPAVNFANTVGTAAGTTMNAADMGTCTGTAGQGFTVNASVTIATVALTSVQIQALEANATATTAYLVAFNSTTGVGEIWYDANWGAAGGEVQVATLTGLTTLASVTALTNADFLAYI